VASFADRAGRRDPVAWDVALGVARQAVRVVGDPVSDAEVASLQEELSEVTARAERLVEAASGLRAVGAPTRAKVVTRQGWAEANVGSFRRLLRPLGERLAARSRRSLTPASAIAAGVEVGLVLGWLSGRVLGQYDLLPGEAGGAGEGAGSEGAGGAVYYVAPNSLGLERLHGFPPSQFRLWIALHEVTHRLQFTGVPWMRQHFLGIVERGTDLATPDLGSLLASLRRAALAVREGRNPLAEGGIVALLATSEQLATLQEAQALMSLLEGHSDVVMSKAAAEEIPEASRFAATLHERRTSASGLARAVQQVIGLEQKMLQYAEGERFVEALLEAGGDELLAKVWTAPEMLPSLEEVREPGRWVARARGKAVATA
jgi:coenzyme F420 biosynthesis associated uncharacterized protein